MSQDPSINQPLLEASGQPKPSNWNEDIPVAEPSTFSIDTYADDLMDELFEEVDHILEKGVKMPPETDNPEYVALQPITVPEMGLPSVLVPHRQVEADQLEQLEADLELLPSESQADKRYGFGKSLDQLLLISACASLVLTALLGIMLQGKWQPALAPQNSVAVDQLSQSDAEFLDYMERSLDVIDRRATANNSSTTAEIPAPPAATSPTSSSQPAQASVPERVFVPVYQPPQNLSFPGLGQPAQPAQPAQPTQPSQVVPPIQPAVPAAPAASAPAAVATAPNIAPTLNYTLVGLLELGDRSAALFEVNGTPQRIYVGESIGSSGWTLVSVQNEEALIRRNGEVRSVYVGQRF
ncbi:hypothetical protein H6F93_10995 [Leptolyngbya sp. FACHB-671]|uniref:hypothetical protein n=1 Tax=unclassified Leptolyngbya TaxID=2650499 RepID=UPI001687700D|nr:MULTISPECIES: hypothetical protein [unclassified Leptolyngbya]MBD2001621.1 hypothetical protein [Leptolyngbya sp. FACHB-541]MBD2068043.1 hypothetical protein [Leptolyngbya sp. FACHB-671]